MTSRPDCPSTSLNWVACDTTSFRPRATSMSMGEYRVVMGFPPLTVLSPLGLVCRSPMPTRGCARLVRTCSPETPEIGRSTPRSNRFASLPEELRIEGAPTKARHIDPELFHLVIKCSFRHL